MCIASDVSACSVPTHWAKILAIFLHIAVFRKRVSEANEWGFVTWVRGHKKGLNKKFLHFLGPNGDKFSEFCHILSLVWSVSSLDYLCSHRRSSVKLTRFLFSATVHFTFRPALRCFVMFWAVARQNHRASRRNSASNFRTQLFDCIGLINSHQFQLKSILLLSTLEGCCCCCKTNKMHTF